MLNEKSTIIFSDYLSQHAEFKVTDIDSVLGFICGLLACSEFYGESEIVGYIADKNDPAYATMMTESQERDAMITLLDNITQAQVEQRHFLAETYPHSDSDTMPSARLQHWCKGYLAGYEVNQAVWEQDFSFLVSADKQQVTNQADGQLFIDNFEATLNLLATFSAWENTLTQQPEPDKLSANFPLLYKSLDESLTAIASMALMLEDEKLSQFEEEG
ncbi:UPF0149 family protein [Pseudoalteromonas sp. NEC-BIFX-2020_002]|uniref:UPF0149 family protein n=1 Tax=Pseudoalteromonas sp. NEC-BIFX-2020_002 TaxID=2732353 RepID=UPI00147716EC|nr:UPF0149 family protein [Pseudoalteromonas sp. NEC-BIFX-2020_002]NNG41733.1 UPF0149 family protein [Pseudoalteromonas sp. NEC-BIFX-2020_002]